MKKNISLRLDEELIELLDNYRNIQEEIYHIEMNQTVAAEALLKSGLKNHIKLLQAIIESPAGKEEFDKEATDSLNILKSKFDDYTLKGKKGATDGYKK